MDSASVWLLEFSKSVNTLFERNGCQSLFEVKHNCSKAPSYTASSNMGLADTRFLIGSKTIWDTRIYVVKTLKAAPFYDNFALTLLINFSCMNFELHGFFLVPKNVHLKALLYLKILQEKYYRNMWLYLHVTIFETTKLMSNHYSLNR